MISLRDVSLHRGVQPLLEGVSLLVSRGARIGLVGANGAGKSSLFALLLGELHADAGEVDVPAGLEIAHVAQEIPRGTDTALAFVLAGDRRLVDLEREIAAAELADDGVALASLHEAFATHDGYRAPARAASILHGLGFATEQQQQPIDAFSGGWRARLNLGRALMAPADLLLLDEPTNHLDLDAVVWLEAWLRACPSTLLLISHDRDFLDGVTDGIAHIEHRGLRFYSGNYADFERQRAARLAQQDSLHARQQREIARVRSFIDRFRAKATKARQAQSRVKALERLELVAAAEVDSPIRFAFSDPDACPNPLLRLEEAAAGYGDRRVLSGISLDVAPGARIGLLGRNGAGKSTLVGLLAGTLAPQAGLRHAAQRLAVGYFAQHQLEALRGGDSPLQHLQRLAPTAREQELRDFIGGFGFRGDDALRRVATLSGGERTRLALALLVRTRPNLLLLDEPTNHLDMLTRDALVEALQGFAGAVVVVSHDRYLLRACCDRLVLVADGRVSEYDDDVDAYGRQVVSGGAMAVDGQDGMEGAESRRTRRRREAQTRQQRSAARRPLAQRLRRLEADVERLHAELETVNAGLADEMLYAAERKDELTVALQHRGRLQQALAEAEAAWLEAGEALEDHDGAT